ncbi:ROK family protein [Arthrobacter sp. OV608]|uniref:ROK family protein n=1 Tax=Arthrobacter sp. OV608 TaxID=1882768 RepID=UPI0008AC0B58|nr:ROK family protein [Arthrobacter sp. OV608]SEQ44057.1 Sugar kinase of the NBD/HSP70 family, may contain an N-terminal HTH domain [Arthrobacter sp. OV608]
MPDSSASVPSALPTVTIGVDIGGTKTEAVAIDADHRILHTLRVPSGHGNQELLRTLFEVIEELRSADVLAGYSVAALGIGIPGTVDTSSGHVSNAVNVRVCSLELGLLTQRELGIKVHVENDVNAAALGAHHLLSKGQNPKGLSSAYLNLGTGLAAGFVSNGSLVRGATGAAGEIGHLPTNLHAEVCPCGQTGCLEMLASGSAIARQWNGGGPWPAVSLFEAALAGHPQATEIRDRFFQAAAAAIRILGLTYDPSAIYIGGGLNALGQPLMSGLRRELTRADDASPFLAGLALGQRVRLVPAGQPIGAVGAAVLATI